jgi:hypothetical protein
VPAGDPAETHQPVLAYVGGMGRSGSTLLTRVLARLPNTVSIGEQPVLFSEGVRNNQICGCGERFHDCPLWSEVGRLAFGGWDRVDVDEMWRLRKRVENLRHLPMLLAPAGRTSFSRDADSYRRSAVRIYQAISAASGAGVIVDNSKNPARAALLRSSPEVDLRVIHLVRSSYGVCYSWTKNIERSDAPGRRMLRTSVGRSAAQWMGFNGGFELLAGLGVPRLVVRYEDFVAAPETEARRMLDFLGCDYADDDLAFIGDGTVDLRPDHSIWGNPTRMQSGPVPVRADEAWRKALPADRRRVIGVITAPLLQLYGYPVRVRK